MEVDISGRRIMGCLWIVAKNIICYVWLTDILPQHSVQKQYEWLVAGLQWLPYDTFYVYVYSIKLALCMYQGWKKPRFFGKSFQVFRFFRFFRFFKVFQVFLGFIRFQCTKTVGQKFTTEEEHPIDPINHSPCHFVFFKL